MSNEYRHILVAVDLTKDSHKVLERALPIAERNQAKLSIMHTLEPLGFAYGGDIPMDLTSIQDQLDDHAKQRSKHARQGNTDQDRHTQLRGQVSRCECTEPEERRVT